MSTAVVPRIVHVFADATVSANIRWLPARRPVGPVSILKAPVPGRRISRHDLRDGLLRVGRTNPYRRTAPKRLPKATALAGKVEVRLARAA
jgi:hypothetical protein